VDPVPDPLLLRKSGSAGNRAWDLRKHGVASQKAALFIVTIFCEIVSEADPLQTRSSRTRRNSRSRQWPCPVGRVVMHAVWSVAAVSVSSRWSLVAFPVHTTILPVAPPSYQGLEERDAVWLGI
jgi:hypothetical protein